MAVMLRVTDTTDDFSSTTCKRSVIILHIRTLVTATTSGTLPADSNLAEPQQNLKEYAMKKTTMISSLVLFVATMMLSGCIFPYWGDEGGGHRGGGHYEHFEGGRR